MLPAEQVIQGIQAFGASISSQPLCQAKHAPEPWAKPRKCFQNAGRKVSERGGVALHGWMFQVKYVGSYQGPAYLVAIHHAVWNAPDKKLIDVTPFHEDRAHHPIVLQGVLFQVDSTALPYEIGNELAPLASRFFPLTAHKELEAHLARLRDEEAQACQVMYNSAATEPG